MAEADTHELGACESFQRDLSPTLRLNSDWLHPSTALMSGNTDVKLFISRVSVGEYHSTDAWMVILFQWEIYETEQWRETEMDKILPSLQCLQVKVKILTVNQNYSHPSKCHGFTFDTRCKKRKETIIPSDVSVEREEPNRTVPVGDNEADKSEKRSSTSVKRCEAIFQRKG